MDDLKRLLESTESAVELSSGHAKRFEDKLRLQFPKKILIPKKIAYLSIAASIAVILSLFTIIKVVNQDKPTNLIFAQEEMELIETEVYLQNTINQKLAEINSLKDVIDKTNILKDISEVDETLKVLRDDYKEAPGDSRVINAVIITYMRKIEALDNIKIILQKNS